MLVGRILGAFGVRGEMKVQLHTDYPERLSDLRSVFLGPEHAKRTVKGVRLHKGQALLTLEGIESPEAATRLHGTEVWVPKAEAVQLPEGHYFLDDLVGIDVLTHSGSQLGQIIDVLRTGSNDVYVVRKGSVETLVPGIRDAIVRLDLQEREMIVADWVLQSE